MLKDIGKVIGIQILRRSDQLCGIHFFQKFSSNVLMQVLEASMSRFPIQQTLNYLAGGWSVGLNRMRYLGGSQ